MGKGPPFIGKSMLPLIKPGDKPVIARARNYLLNDIAVFKRGEKLMAHRVIYIPPRGTDYLITRGDNNFKDDGEIKRKDILGKVVAVKRGGGEVKLSHIYLSQSLAYLKQLEILSGELTKRKVSFIILKGPLVHIAYSGSPPKRLYLDADILVKGEDYLKAKNILSSLGFKLAKQGAPGNLHSKFPAQEVFIQDKAMFPIVIDLHREAAIGFTKAPGLNKKLLPELGNFNNYLFSSIKEVKINKNFFPILKKEALFVYLLTHLFHHNFQGPHRLSFLVTVAKKKIDWGKLGGTVKKHQLENFVYPGFLMLKKYYQAKFPKKLLEETKPNLGIRLLTKIFLFFNNPFSPSRIDFERTKRFLFILALSPSPLLSKISVFVDKRVYFYFLLTIKSFFSSSSKKASKSLSASS